MKSPVKACLSINYQDHLLPLVTLAALVLLAPPAFAQTYTIIDLDPLGTNSLSPASHAFRTHHLSTRTAVGEPRPCRCCR